MLWRFLVVAGIAFILPAVSLGAACTAGTSLLTFQLVAEPDGEKEMPISVRSVNDLMPGQKIVYAPIGLGRQEKNEGDVSLILVPSEGKEELKVLKPHDANTFAEWPVPFRTSVVALVYGPRGLDMGKVSALIKKDSELVEQLADYAKQTAQTEKLLDALSAWDRSPTTTENLNAALAGFSSSYGRALPRFDASASADQQVAAMMRALNPALATYDPLAPESTQRMKQSAILASSVAGLFFGSPVGLAAGGAAMFVNLSGMMFPDTKFSSSFVQEADSHTMVLCAKRVPHKSRTRQAYLWAARIPNADAPSLSLSKATHLPIGAVSRIDVRIEDNKDWQLVSRVRDWTLISNDTKSPVSARVSPVADSQKLIVDLRSEEAKPGSYHLRGRWDWQPVEVAGEIHLRELNPSAAAQLPEGSSDRLIQDSGDVTVRLTGRDFQFVDKAAMKKAGGSGDGASQTLSFKLPEGRRAGPQEEIDVTVPTNNMEPGPWVLQLSLPDASTVETPFRLLPPNPQLENIPLRANLGEAEQKFTLKGTGLDRVEAVDCDQAEVKIGEPGEITVALASSVKKGDLLDVRLKVEGLHEPVPVAGLIRVAGPRPKIIRSQVSLPGGLNIELEEGEVLAGSVASFSLAVEPRESTPTLRFNCKEEDLIVKAASARPGNGNDGLRLRTAGPGALFLSLDPGLIGQPGCTLMATLETEDGRSDPYELGSVIRLPRIDEFELTDQPASEDSYVGVIKGEELEMIELAGWDSARGLPVLELPTPLADGGYKQSLKVALPWPAPSPHARLYVWLRGEARGRATNARY